MAMTPDSEEMKRQHHQDQPDNPYDHVPRRGSRLSTGFRSDSAPLALRGLRTIVADTGRRMNRALAFSSIRECLRRSRPSMSVVPASAAFISPDRFDGVGVDAESSSASQTQAERPKRIRRKVKR